MLENFPGPRKFYADPKLLNNKPIPCHHEGTKDTKDSGIIIFNFLPSCSSCLCGEMSVAIWLRLCRARIFDDLRGEMTCLFLVAA